MCMQITDPVLKEPEQDTLSEARLHFDKHIATCMGIDRSEIKTASTGRGNIHTIISCTGASDSVSMSFGAE